MKTYSLRVISKEQSFEYVCLGALSVDIPDQVAQQHAEFISDRVITFIEREAEWVNRGVQPRKVERRSK